MARNCKLATKLRTFKSMWEMRRVPQPNVERRRSFNIDQNGGEKLWIKNSRRLNEGVTNLGDKIWRKTSEIEIWDRNCRNEFTGGKLREGN